MCIWRVYLVEVILNPISLPIDTTSGAIGATGRMGLNTSIDQIAIMHIVISGILGSACPRICCPDGMYDVTTISTYAHVVVSKFEDVALLVGIDKGNKPCLFGAIFNF